MKALIQKLRNINGRTVVAAILGGGMVVLLGGGTAVAASKIGTEDIRNYAITKTKIRGEAVGELGSDRPLAERRGHPQGFAR